LAHLPRQTGVDFRPTPFLYDSFNYKKNFEMAGFSRRQNAHDETKPIFPPQMRGTPKKNKMSVQTNPFAKKMYVKKLKRMTKQSHFWQVAVPSEATNPTGIF